MSWWRRLAARLGGDRAARPPRAAGDPLESAADSLRRLLDDPSVPPAVRDALRADYEAVRAMLDKLERGDLHLAAFGRVSVGKSALLNALLGAPEFEVGVLHGTTRRSAIRRWREVERAGAHLIDTPGINELDGEAREALAHEVATRADLVLFVVDGDLTDTELDALRALGREQRPVVLVLNKSDRYTADERALLLARLREHAAGIVAPENVVAAAAMPAPRTVVRVDEAGYESEIRETRAPELDAVRDRLVAIAALEGRELAAINAALCAGRLSDAVAARIAEARAAVTDPLIRSYCLAKGLTVALNPIPVADLIAAAALDVSLVMHLSRVYDLPLTEREAGRLLATITTTLAALLGAVWGTHLAASALKGATGGLSTVVTAGAQGAVAWYATLVVGRAAQSYLRNGKSWREHGPKRVVQEIVAKLDRESILREAREEITRRLRRGTA